MEQYIIIGILLAIAIIAIISEHFDREKIPDLPSCSYISNYCTEYGDKQNIKYVTKEPNTIESISALFSKIETDSCIISDTVNWRMSLIVSLIICIFFWMFNTLEGSKIKGTTYFFIFVISWFFGYLARNYLDYHYHRHSCNNVKEAINQLKSNFSILHKNFSVQ
jgi:uncharacterized membrane protein (DUF106 family)